MALEREEFRCPISMSVMADPVILPETGITYDRHAITAWFDEGGTTCPCTGVHVTDKRLIPNRVLKTAIDEWKKANPKHSESPKTLQHKPAVEHSPSNDTFTWCFSWLWRSSKPNTPAARTVPAPSPASPQLQTQQKPSRDIAHQMTAAVKAKDEDGLYRLHREGWSFDVLDVSGQSPLHISANQDDPRILSLLIGCGASVDFRDKSGCTALHWAARWGHHAICKSLLTSGADVQAQSLARTTPLHMAAYWGRLQVVELLIRHGANLHARNEKQQTPFDVAQQSPWDSARTTSTLLQQYAKSS